MFQQINKYITCGDSVFVYVTATDTGEQKITLGWSSACQASYQVVNIFDWINDKVCNSAPTSLTLEPSQSYTWTFKIKDEYHFPVGSYKIFGEVLGYDNSDTIEFRFVDTLAIPYAAYYYGKVLDTINHPILFALIKAEGADSTYNDYGGDFLIRFLPSAFSDSLTIHPLIKFSNPYYEEYSERITISKGDSISGPDVILKPRTTGMATVTGHIDYGNNDYIRDIYIIFYGVNGSTWYSTSPNSSGDYSIQVAQDSYYAQCWINYHLENFPTSRGKYYNDKPDLKSADLLIINKDTSNINFSFPLLKTGTISGKVRDAVSQQPLSYAWIMVSSVEPGDSSGISTDQNGNYSIRVFEGDYILFADEMEHYMQFYKEANNVFDATPVKVDSDNLNVTGIDFDLTKPESGTNTISGTVRERSSYQWLSNVQVYTMPVEGGNLVESRSDYNGHYALRDIANGKYVLLFNKDGYTSVFYKDANQWEDAFVFDLTGSQNIHADDVFLSQMNPFGGEISGKISSNTGTSLSGTLITAVNLSDSVVSTSFSNHEGSYTIPSLINGDYSIKASKIGYKTSEYSNKVKIDMSSQKAVDGINISITLTGIDEKENTIPGSFNLFQNYPNPFNPSTLIKYELPKESNVQLIIYNILGEKVAELVNTFQKAGRYEVNWDAKSFSSGVYICQMRAGDPISGTSFISSKKLILLK